MAGSEALFRETSQKEMTQKEMPQKEMPQKEMPHPEAVILDIQRMSTEDGPGLRTTVFFKGCNLSCPWCHNPESIDKKPVVTWFPRRCIGCGICRKACPQKGISSGEEGIRFNRSLCLACGTCAEECPGGAIEIKGRNIPVDKLAAELLKDFFYFGKDGGVTLSGGEVMVQHEAALELTRLLKAAGINIAIDTAGCYDFSLLEAMLPYIDLVLYDLKIFDSEAHKRLLGAGNSLILENYRRLMDMKVRVWVRTPIIPGATDSEENIAAIGNFIAKAGRAGDDIPAGRGENSPGTPAVNLPERWELCAFNKLCRDKYDALDRDWAYKDAGLTEKTHIEKLTMIAARYFPGAVYTGAVAETGGEP